MASKNESLNNIFSIMVNLLILVQFFLSGIFLYFNKDVFPFFDYAFKNEDYSFLLSFFVLLITVIVSITMIIWLIEPERKGFCISIFSAFIFFLFITLKCIIVDNVNEYNYLFLIILNFIILFISICIYYECFKFKTKFDGITFSFITFTIFFVNILSLSFLYKKDAHREYSIPYVSDFLDNLELAKLFHVKGELLSLHLQYFMILILILLMNCATLFYAYELSNKLKKNYFGLYCCILFAISINIIAFYFTHFDLIKFI